MNRRKWDRDRIIRKIRSLQHDGVDLSYNAMCRKNQALVSASNYHYGAYKRAVMMAGIDYARYIKKPWWTDAWIVRLIKQAKRSGEELNWRAVSARRDALGHAALAAVRPRLFGSWDKALEAAGLDTDRVRKYHKWDRPRILAELRDRVRKNKPVNSGVVQREIPGLYGAATRIFGSYDEALRAAKLDPLRVRERREWDRPIVLEALRGFDKRHGAINNTLLRKHDPSLQKGVNKIFRSLDSALAAMGKTNGRARLSPPGKDVRAKHNRADAARRPGEAKRGKWKGGTEAGKRVKRLARHRV